MFGWMPECHRHGEWNIVILLKVSNVITHLPPSISLRLCSYSGNGHQHRFSSLQNRRRQEPKSRLMHLQLNCPGRPSSCFCLISITTLFKKITPLDKHCFGSWWRHAMTHFCNESSWLGHLIAAHNTEQSYSWFIWDKLLSNMHGTKCSEPSFFSKHLVADRWDIGQPSCYLHQPDISICTELTQCTVNTWQRTSSMTKITYSAMTQVWPDASIAPQQQIRTSATVRLCLQHPLWSLKCFDLQYSEKHGFRLHEQCDAYGKVHHKLFTKDSQGDSGLLSFMLTLDAVPDHATVRSIEVYPFPCFCKLRHLQINQCDRQPFECEGKYNTLLFSIVI